MRTANPGQSRTAHAAFFRCVAQFAAAAGFVAALQFAAATQISAQPTATATTAHKPLHARRPPAKATVPASAVKPALEPQSAPKPPDWPVNDQPSEATVVWNSQGLRVDASNSSLGQILKEVSTATGLKVDGFGADERIFGSYGPAPARDVLARLLDGSGYNVLMIGDQGQGTPRQIVLTAQPKGDAPPAANNPAPANNDDNADADEQPEQPQQPQPAPFMRNGLGPGAPPRTPQQIMQEMQQRQQQQMQQNNPQ